MAVFKSTMTCPIATRKCLVLVGFSDFLPWIPPPKKCELPKHHPKKSTKNNPNLWKSRWTISNSFKFLFFRITLHPSGPFLGLGSLPHRSYLSSLPWTSALGAVSTRPETKPLRIPLLRHSQIWHPWHPDNNIFQRSQEYHSITIHHPTLSSCQFGQEIQPVKWTSHWSHTGKIIYNFSAFAIILYRQLLGLVRI